MNVQSIKPSFKGKYLVSGTRQDVDKAEKIVKNNVPLSTYKIDYKPNKTIGIFATEKDSVILDKSIAKNPDSFVADTKKSLKSNLAFMLKKVFPNHSDIMQTRIIPATQIIKTETANNDIFPFQYARGQFSSKETLCLDGNHRTFYYNGGVEAVKYPDGSIKEYYSDGTLHKTTSSSGIIKTFFEDGFIKSEKQPDGSGIEYYNNGNVKERTDSNGNTITYYVDGSIKSKSSENGEIQELYENGRLKKTHTPEGGYTLYYTNGNIASVVNADGTGEDYDENGILTSKKNKDGSKVEFYPNGQKRATITPNLIVTTFYENGRIKSIVNKDKTYTIYNENGFIVTQNDSNGLIHNYSYDNEGLLDKETISNGVINRFKKGVWLSKQEEDGRIYNFAPYNGDDQTSDFSKNIPGYTNLHGQIQSIEFPDSSIKYFDERGNLSYEKTKDGEYIQY